MNKRIRYFFIILFILASQLIVWENAAGQSERWTLPYRLSSGKGKADEASLVADKYGFVHAFWPEELADSRTIIQYTRFDGESWTFPIDIYFTAPFIGTGSISPAVDEDGILHLIWTEGMTGPAYYSYAPASDAVTALNWAKPTRITIPADSAEFKIDSQGIFHVLYVDFLGEKPGVYYIRSENRGLNWSVPVWLDPDITENHGPRSLHFALDSEDGLHAAWFYVPRDDVGGNWVRYIHSLDGGDTWSTPFTIDIKADNNSGLQTAGPIMTVSGKNVHIVWAAGDPFYFRHHRFSSDAGQTWSAPARIMGDLNGQAFDGMAVDGAGRVHYFAQLRFPMGVYHTYWENDHWSSPSLMYFIRASDQDPVNDQIAAHHTHAAVRAGNQLVLTFNDNPGEPNRRLFTMNLLMTDTTAAVLEPTPEIEITEEVLPTVQISPTATVRAPISDQNATISELPSPGASLFFGFIPPVMLLFGVIFYITVVKNRR